MFSLLIKLSFCSLILFTLILCILENISVILWKITLILIVDSTKNFKFSEYELLSKFSNELIVSCNLFFCFK